MLASDLRPKALDDIIGQGPVILPLKAMLVKETVPHVLLFSGPKGSGKTTTARIMSHEIAQEDSLGIIEIDAASHGSVVDIRKLVESLSYTVSWTRVIIIDELQNLSREAFDALLSTLEDLPDNTYFIFATTLEHKIPETILSRCVTFQFRKIPTKNVLVKLTSVGTTLGITDAELLNEIALRCDGSMRSALSELQKLSAAGIITLNEFNVSLNSIDFAPELIHRIYKSELVIALDYLDEIKEKVSDSNYILDQCVYVFKDALILQSKGDIRYQGQRLASRQLIAKEMSSLNIVKCLKILWKVKTDIKSTEDFNAVLLLTIVMMKEALNG